MPRPSLDTLYLRMAGLIATRGTCPRRQVGCVLVDARGRVLSMGYNGVPSGQPHCNEGFARFDAISGDLVTGLQNPCPGAHYPSGEGLDKCQAIHAEQNAVVLLHDPLAVHTAYITVTPCHSCVKLLLATSCQRIVAMGKYSHSDAIEEWKANGREIILWEEES